MAIWPSGHMDISCISSTVHRILDQHHHSACRHASSDHRLASLVQRPQVAGEGNTRMSRDPYHDFASDLRASLSSARSLCQVYQDQIGQASSQSGSSSRRASTDVGSAHDRLCDAIEGLRQDVEDVKQSVLVVERSGAERFGVSPDELVRRKKFVEECEAEIKVSVHCARPRSTG